MLNSTLVVQPNANTPDIAIIGARIRHAGVSSVLAIAQRRCR